MTAVIITLCVALVIVVISLLITVYHQMLLTNEINKRLLLMMEDFATNERNTMDELNRVLQERDQAIADKLDINGIKEEPEEEEYQDFNPHDALESLE